MPIGIMFEEGIKERKKKITAKEKRVFLRSDIKENKNKNNGNMKLIVKKVLGITNV